VTQEDWLAMIVAAVRVALGTGFERVVLILGARTLNVPQRMRDDPRFVFWDSSDPATDRKTVVPENTHVVLMTRFVTHELTERISRALPADAHFFRRPLNTGMLRKIIEEAMTEPGGTTPEVVVSSAAIESATSEEGSREPPSQDFEMALASLSTATEMVAEAALEVGRSTESLKARLRDEIQLEVWNDQEEDLRLRLRISVEEARRELERLTQLKLDEAASYANQLQSTMSRLAEETADLRKAKGCLLEQLKQADITTQLVYIDLEDAQAVLRSRRRRWVSSSVSERGSVSRSVMKGGGHDLAVDNT
jgi:hypothetical protein